MESIGIRQQRDRGYICRPGIVRLDSGSRNRGTGRQERQLSQVLQMQRAQSEHIRSVAGNPAPGALDQIGSARGLLDNGTITRAEFDQLKAKALAA